jgi:hypothetical protein
MNHIEKRQEMSQDDQRDQLVKQLLDFQSIDAHFGKIHRLVDMIFSVPGRSGLSTNSHQFHLSF